MIKINLTSCECDRVFVACNWKCACRTSWGGMSKVMVRMSTLMKLSVHGKMKNSPAEITRTQIVFHKD